MSTNKYTLCYTPPIEKENIRITAPETIAAGVPAVAVTLKHIFGEMNWKNCAPTLFSINQMDGFDCPGCAWPDPDDHRSSLGEYCENGAKAIAEEATAERATPEFFAKHSVQEMSNWSDYKIGKSGRITHPMILKEGATHYEPIGWNDAFDFIAKKLNALDSPNEAIFYTSGRTSNEAAFLYQLFVRQYGTNNLPDCSNMCHESSGVGLSETVGIGKGSVKLDDFYKTDLIIIMGQNPGTNHPRMLSALQKAKRNGVKIISINPLKEAGLTKFKNPQEVRGWLGSGTVLSDLYLQVMVNGDVSLLKAIMLVMLEREESNPGTVFDKDFIEKNTAGYESFITDLKKYDLTELAHNCGISILQIKETAEMIISNKNMIICWAMGLTQHKNGVDNIREVVNLLLLRGSIGKAGAGTCPVRGHSNVQGDRTVGIWEKLKPEFAENLKNYFQFDPPKKEGYNVVHAIKAMHEKRAKVFFAMGGNFLSATPDTRLTGAALQNCDLTVHISTKPNRSHLITGNSALILPCLGRTEVDIQNGKKQFVTVENSMGVVHQSRGILKPASEHLLSEPSIVVHLAKATLKNTKTDWQQFANNYDLIRTAIENTVSGFQNYNERVRKPGGFYLPNGARDGDFKTDTGKANFSINEVSNHKLSEGEYLMMTIRSHDQYNTTIYGMNDRYRGIHNGRRIVMMHPDDMIAEELKEGDFVDLTSNYDDVERIAPKFYVVAYDIPRRCIGTYFPEANPLIPFDKYATKSETPISKSVIIRMKKVENA